MDRVSSNPGSMEHTYIPGLTVTTSAGRSPSLASYTRVNRSFVGRGNPPWLRVSFYSPPLTTGSNASFDAANSDELLHQEYLMTYHLFSRGVPLPRIPQYPQYPINHCYKAAVPFIGYSAMMLVYRVVRWVPLLQLTGGLCVIHHTMVFAYP